MCGAAFCVLAATAWALRQYLPALAPGDPAAETAVVVLDPGHGGEDGGAVSPDGTPESGINLAVAQKTGALLGFFGVRTVYTRQTPEAVGDPDLPTVRARKASDIRRRVETANAVPGGALISIHQNSLPSSPGTHGAQVFWNRQSGAEDLAKAIQEALNRGINQGNEKTARPISPDIYLMKHAEIPAALVECGFLSNAAETERLRQDAYQLELAAAIAAGYLNHS